VRALAGQSRQSGTHMAQRVNTLKEQVDRALAQTRRHDTEADELALQADENARAVVRSLVGSVAEVSRSSRTLREAGRQIQTDIDDILVSLQSQDRLSQMLTSVTDDMGRLEAVLAGEPDPAAQSAVQWLERLDASYTMEEMRSSHHDTVSIERNAAVEFF
jgi:methyl-accepting chemotaxis protein